MLDELTALKRNQTWDLVNLPTGKNLVSRKWVHIIKYKADGSLDQFKTRLVAKSYSQTISLDYLDTFSPVAKLNSFRLLISLATNPDWPLHQLDVTNAFLHGDLQEVVYMQQSPGFVAEGESNKVCLLQKSIYGLKQSPRAWFNKFSTILLDIGFAGCVSDYSMFVKKTEKGCIILTVYVDELVISGSDVGGI